MTEKTGDTGDTGDRCYPDRCVQIGVLIKDVVH